ncbi:MAG: glycosyltransferase family 4 protein [Nitrospirae bacterium]|nr:glycosyltransferase family 4 protein [Nitrospirota bacterium]
MKIFVIGARGFPGVQGGIESHCEELYPRLVRKGFEVTALTIKQYTETNNWKGISFIKVPSASSKTFQKPIYNLISAIYCILRRPDIIHVHGLNAGLFIWLFRLFGLKVVATYHSMDYLYPKWNALVKAMLRYSEKQFLSADYIITVSKPYLKHFNERRRTQAISYLPNGVNLLDDGHEKNKNTILDGWGLQENGYILTVGRITPEKDILTLIKAFTKAKLSGIKLAIVGSAEFQEQYFEILKRISNDNVIFTGQLNKNDLSVLYSNCRLFVLSSLYEGLPNALLEAMSFNCNILISDIDSHIAVGMEQDDYFKAQDIEDLANKIDQKIPKNKKKDYSQFLLKNYNWDIVADEVSKIYAETRKTYTSEV